MSLSENLSITAAVMIEKYGNTVTISSTTNDNVYNPQTGMFGSIVNVEHTKKAYESKATTSLLEKSGLPQDMWGSIKSLYVMTSDDEVDNLDSNWKINGHPITEIKTVKAKDNILIYNIYVG